MEGHEGHLDGESEERACKEDEGDVLRRKAVPSECSDDRRHELAVLRERCDVDEIELVGAEEDCEEREQHPNAAHHGVDEELSRGFGAVGTAPEFDKEECWDEAKLPEDEPVEEIEGGKGAEETGLERENERIVKADAIADLRRRGEGDGDDNGGEEKHEQAEAIYAQVVIDADCRDPGVSLLELQGA